MNLHFKLGELRKERNLSQEKLAEIIGVTRQSVAKWEMGESLPELEKLIQISNFFRVSLDSLVRETENCSAIKPESEPLDDSKQLVQFICKAKKLSYAGHGAETNPSRTNSHDLTYRENELMYYDSYLGGEKFAGQEAIWKNDLPVWSMNYIGKVMDEAFSGDFLREALGLVPEDFPYRGPLIHNNGEFSYHCKVSGCFEWFSGNEEIFFRERKVYECMFHGGSVK